ncbi:hypothetical protein INT48_008920 [Thamnidium elegans]|uniref:Uncharacterized protein n=1 Tax=Thamnidium elegans TaxID=101142 RepID=A0A8H7VYJ7_9FUNG|nr:hypothetical protein INT48_008920 [Thamnidium elegans]
MQKSERALSILEETMYLSAFMVIKRSEECLVTRGFYSYGGTFQRLKSQQEMKRRTGITTIESNILTAKSTILVKYREHEEQTCLRRLLRLQRRYPRKLLRRGSFKKFDNTKKCL